MDAWAPAQQPQGPCPPPLRDLELTEYTCAAVGQQKQSWTINRNNIWGGGQLWHGTRNEHTTRDLISPIISRWGMNSILACSVGLKTSRSDLSPPPLTASLRQDVLLAARSISHEPVVPWGGCLHDNLVDDRTLAATEHNRNEIWRRCHEMAWGNREGIADVGIAQLKHYPQATDTTNLVVRRVKSEKLVDRFGECTGADGKRRFFRGPSPPP